jgi:sugar phosphate isomerase/epimerase
MDRRIGAQYFTIRKEVKTLEDFELACKKVSDIGYKVVQISGMPLKAKEMREVLDKYNLEVVTTHKGYMDFIEDIDEVIDYNKTLGCRVCGLGMMPKEYADSNAKVTRMLKALGRAAEELQKEGLVFGYHNHSIEFIPVDGKRTIFDRMVEETNPDNFQFILDTYWLQVGGKTPQDVIRQIGKRAPIVHFKDFTIEASDWKTPQMTEVGNGNLNWDAIVAACEESGVQYCIVEQDRNHVDDDSFKALASSYEFLKTKGFY